LLLLFDGIVKLLISEILVRVDNDEYGGGEYDEYGGGEYKGRRGWSASLLALVKLENPIMCRGRRAGTILGGHKLRNELLHQKISIEEGGPATASL
jgi:hypothetical protein